MGKGKYASHNNHNTPSSSSSSSKSLPDSMELLALFFSLKSPLCCSPYPEFSSDMVSSPCEEEVSVACTPPAEEHPLENTTPSLPDGSTTPADTIKDSTVENYEDYHYEEYNYYEDFYYDDLEYDGCDPVYDDMECGVLKDFDYYLSLAEDWEASQPAKKKTFTQRRPKDIKGPKSCPRVNGPRHNLLAARRAVALDQYEKQRSNSSVDRALKLSLSTSSSHRSNNSSFVYNTPTAAYTTSSTSALDCGLTAAQLNDLQNRELTPEDYEMLLALDASVPKKTLSLSTIDTLALKTILEVARDADDRCVVCFCEYERGCTVRTLPCGHVFHSDCIVNWLTNSSVNCPIDGLPLS